jgi:nitroreductase
MNSYFLELIKNRRSIRKYAGSIIEDDKLDIILRAALWSPSSRGLTPWQVIAVNDKDILKELSRAKHGAEMLKDSPLGIVVFADPEKSDVWIEDCSIVSSNILLAAQDLSLGACWVQIRNRDHDASVSSNDHVKKVLNIPTKYEVLSIISVGYPDEKKKPHNDRDLQYNKVHYNKY